MTPNERLLKAAKRVLFGQVNTVADVRILKEEMLELEAAVKACEAAEAIPAGTATEVSREYLRVCCGNVFHSEQDYLSHTHAGGVPGRFTDDGLIERIPTAPTLTDGQRRMGLRSLRHMGPDWGNYDYD